MTQFAKKSFSVACSSGAVDADEMARRWEETFGKRKSKTCDEALAAFSESVASAPAGYQLELNAGTDALDFSGVDMMPVEDA